MIVNLSNQIIFNVNDGKFYTTYNGIYYFEIFSQIEINKFLTKRFLEKH